MLEIALHEAADEEFKAAMMFYESKELGLGGIFHQRITEGFEFIAANPLASEIIFDNFHRYPVRQFPYSIVRKFLSGRWLTGSVVQGIGGKGSLDARGYYRFLRRCRRPRNQRSA